MKRWYYGFRVHFGEATDWTRTEKETGIGSEVGKVMMGSRGEGRVVVRKCIRGIGDSRGGGGGGGGIVL